MRKILFLMFATFLLVLNGCGSKEVTKEEIIIGAVVPLSGKYSVVGESIQEGMDLAVEEINIEGGINGVPIKLIYEDTKSEVSGAVSGMSKLINVDKVSFVIGGILSGEAAAIAPIAQENGVVLFSPTATTEVLDDAGDYIFKMREGASLHSEVISDVMVENDVDNLAVMYLTTEFCTNLVENQLPEYVSKNNIKIDASKQYQAEDSDFRSQIIKIKEADTDGVFVCGYYNDLGLVFKQMYELELKQKKFTIATFQNPTIKGVAGLDAMEGIMYTLSPFDCKSPSGKVFCENYNKKYNKEPDYRAAFPYDSVYIVAEALKTTTDPKELKEVLLDINFKDGVTGDTSFDEKGNSIKTVIVKQFKDGDWASYP